MIFIGYDYPTDDFSGFKKRLAATIRHYAPDKFILIGDKTVEGVCFLKRKKNSLFNLAKAWTSLTPLVVYRYPKAALNQELENLKDEVLFVNSAVFDISDEVIKRNKIILDEHDLVSETFKRSWQNSSGPKKIFWFIEYKLYKGFEKRFISSLKDSDEILVVNKEHINVYRDYGFNGIITHRPNGYEHPPKSEKQKIVFVGTSHFRNYDCLSNLIEEVLPRMSSEILKTIHLEVIGSYDRKVFDLISSSPVSTSVHHNVESVAAFLNDGKIQCAPYVFGGGSKLKVVESFLNDVPMFGTKTAFTGIPDVPEFFVAKDYEELATKMSLAIEKGESYYRKELDECKLRLEKYSWTEIFS